MKRRKFIITSGVAAAAGLAGCTSGTTELPGDLSGTQPDADQLPQPTRGDGDVTVEVYKDHGCPACHSYYQNTFPEVEQYILDGDITYTYYDYILPADDRSVALANAARAVQNDTLSADDDSGAFWDYIDLLYNNVDSWSDENLLDYAEQVGAEREVVQNGMDTQQFYPTLVHNWNEAQAIDAEGTPWIVVDGEGLDDFDTNTVINGIEEAL